MPQVAVLNYHKVAEHPRAGEPATMAVPPALFAEQMAFLAEAGFRTVPPQSLSVEGLSRTLPPQPLIVTFDDGYRDNHREALPAMRRHGFTGLVFLIGDYLDGADDAPRPCERITPDSPMMGRDEIRELVDEGWCFGSHSMTHARLTEVDDARVRWELSTSRRLVEQITDRDVGTFAYPYGAWLPRLSSLVREAGYELAFTVRRGPMHQGADPFAIRRIPVGPLDTPARLALKLHPIVRAASNVTQRVIELAARSVRGNGARGAGAG